MKIFQIRPKIWTHLYSDEHETNDNLRFRRDVTRTLTRPPTVVEDPRYSVGFRQQSAVDDGEAET